MKVGEDARQHAPHCSSAMLLRGLAVEGTNDHRERTSVAHKAPRLVVQVGIPRKALVEVEHLEKGGDGGDDSYSLPIEPPILWVYRGGSL